MIRWTYGVGDSFFFLVLARFSGVMDHSTSTSDFKSVPIWMTVIENVCERRNLCSLRLSGFHLTQQLPMK